MSERIEGGTGFSPALGRVGMNHGQDAHATPRGEKSDV